MTILTAAVRDIAGVDEDAVFTFRVPGLRESTAGGVLTDRSYVAFVVDGVLTTPDLEPGPAVLTVSGRTGAEFHLTIPDSSDPVQLWPLIEAGLPQPPDPARRYVVNGGGVAIQKWISVSEWNAIAPGDPDTTYYVHPDPE